MLVQLEILTKCSNLTIQIIRVLLDILGIGLWLYRPKKSLQFLFNSDIDLQFFPFPVMGLQF